MTLGRGPLSGDPAPANSTIDGPRHRIFIEPTAKCVRHTTGPFKGEASCWSVRVGDRVHENLVWAYPEPLDEVAVIAGHVAFHLTRVRGGRGLADTAWPMAVFETGVPPRCPSATRRRGTRTGRG